MPLVSRTELMPMWPSVARIVATLAIFVFHYLGLLGLYQYRLSMWALFTFAFLSGYLANARNVPRVQWAVKRYLSVMIPHWLVIGPVLVANWATHYKPISPSAALVTFLGGNLFLENPLYVITWYVTFVLLLYAYLLVDSFFAGWKRLVVTAAGFMVFGRWLGCGEYYLPFTVGLYLAAWVPPAPRLSRGEVARRAAPALFKLQQLCYPFFLVHGAVQLAMIRVTGLTPLLLFAASLSTTILLAAVLQRMADQLMRRATDPLVRRERRLERAPVAT
jgi:peptidoglycan/LPS O-acetylase OafA/YrhL